MKRESQGFFAGDLQVRVHAGNVAPLSGGSVAQQRAQSREDVIGHAAVQPWSAGALFPCVIATVERYRSWEDYRDACRAYRQPYLTYDGYMALDPAHRLASRSYVLHAYGRSEEYATHEDAAKVARWLNRDEAGRARWVARAQFAEVQS